MKRRFLPFLIGLIWAPLWAQTAVIGPGHHPFLKQDGEGRLYLVYENRQDIYLRVSEDGGQSWGAEKALCVTASTSSYPRLAVEPNGAVDVVWQEGTEVWFSRSSDGAVGAPTCLSHSLTSVTEPQVACGRDGSLHVVWIEASKSPDVMYSYSENSGKSWTQPLNLSKTPGVSSHPVLCIGQDKLVHAAWLDTTSGDQRPDIYAVHGSQDSFGRAYNVSNTAGLSRSPDIAVQAQGRVYLVWMDTSRAKQLWDIYFARSEDNGAFSQPIYFDTPQDSLDPCLAIDDRNHLAVAWSDTSENPKAPDIFVVQSGDGGATFTQPKNISHTSGVSRYPSLVLLNDQILAVWEESEQGSTVLKLSRESLTKKSRQPVSSGKY